LQQGIERVGKKHCHDRFSFCGAKKTLSEALHSDQLPDAGMQPVFSGPPLRSKAGQNPRPQPQRQRECAVIVPGVIALCGGVGISLKPAAGNL
jgi:hypothetical protein